MTGTSPTILALRSPSECERWNKYLALLLPVLRLDLRFSECCCSQAWLRHRWEFPRTVRFSGSAANKGRKAPAGHHGSLTSFPKKDRSRSRSALRHAPLRLAITTPALPLLRWPLAIANPLLGADLLLYYCRILGGSIFRFLFTYIRIITMEVMIKIAMVTNHK